MSGASPTADARAPEGRKAGAQRIETVRWHFDPARLPFETTAEVEPTREVVGQASAVEALHFGMASRAHGQNVFVRGLSGTGRMTLVRRMLEEIKLDCPPAPDRCYVWNFEQPDRPRLLSLPRGSARLFARKMDELVQFIREDLARTLASESVKQRKAAMERSAKKKLKKIVEPFEEELRQAGLAFVTIEAGPVSHAALFPLVNGRPTPPEEFAELHERGEISDEEVADFRANQERFAERFEAVAHELIDLRLSETEAMRNFIRAEARSVLGGFVKPIRQQFPQERVARFLGQVVDDFVENRLGSPRDEDTFTQRYLVNVILDHTDDAACPIIVENSPTAINLLGSIDREIGPAGILETDHMMIHGGSLLRADGGYLIVDARDLLSEPNAWKILVRCLRTERLEIVPPAELFLPWGGHSIKPEPIDVRVKVIMIGDAELYLILDQLDPDFPQLFKVLADFDSVIPRDEEGYRHYAAVIARVAEEEHLPPFDRTGVAALIEHGARIASRRGKLTARFSRLADIMREAAFLAGKDARRQVTGDDVRTTVARTKRRANLPSRRFRELLADGTIRVQTTGTAVGQINGIAVLQAGQVAYGFPARITATVGPGSAGVLNIEREANLSGAIHTKGFYILGGLLRHLLKTDHPLTFDASIAFEQSYGGIDGDSASGAEICCLLSALTGVPLRQDLAMTGAIDQPGHILAVGAINEKIEGFFDTCQDIGLTGTQGVIIPLANAGDLVVRPDVAEACAAGRFHVHAVEEVHDALALLTGKPSGEQDDEGRYPEDSVLGIALARARTFWRQATPTPPGGRPGAPTPAADEA